MALPLACGQTMTSPATVASMLVALGVEAGQRILEVGTGSGYVTALLAGSVPRCIRSNAIGTLAESAVRAPEGRRISGARVDVADGLADCGLVSASTGCSSTEPRRRFRSGHAASSVPGPSHRRHLQPMGNCASSADRSRGRWRILSRSSENLCDSLRCARVLPRFFEDRRGSRLWNPHVFGRGTAPLQRLLNLNPF